MPTTNINRDTTETTAKYATVRLDPTNYWVGLGYA